MNYQEAQSLILHEGHGEDGLPICVRSGGDPGVERMRRLLLALRVVFDGLHGQAVIDRRLAGALHAFTAYVFVPVSGDTRSRAWRDEFVQVEVVRLGAAVESIFEGIWVEWV